MQNYDLDNFEPAAKIVVIGVGGAGNNAVNRMIDEDISDVTFYVANTDKQALSTSKASNRIILGEEITGGLGAGGEPEVGAAAAEASADVIREIVKDANTDEVTYKADPDNGYKFDEWIITGVEGVDYEIISGSLDGTPIVIRPLTDKFSITPDFSKVGGEGSGSDTSPVNGDFAATAVLAVAALGLLATKKYAR